MPIDPVRDAAVRALLRVFESQAFVSAAVDKVLRRSDLSERGRRFLTQLVYGTVRYRLLCDHVLTPVLKQPAEQLPRPIHAILRMGVYQALFLNQVPPPAMVHTSVDLAKRHGHAGTARLVNAVLKRIPKRLEDVPLPPRDAQWARHVSVRESVPQWMATTWEAQFGREAAESICRAMNEQADAALRTNLLRTTVDDLVEGLAKGGYPAQPHGLVPEAVVLERGAPPQRSKLFREGFCLIQDIASMLPPHLLEPSPGDRVLDLCAAPGGKSTHLAELTEAQAHVVAADVHMRKAALIRENAERLQTPNLSIVCAEGEKAPFAPAIFDRVLVDAPCTGLGTLRRHPELKWRAAPEDAARFAAKQRLLLRSGGALCKNGGVLVYSVCTMSPEETDGVADELLQTGEYAPEDGPEWLNQWKVAPGKYRTRPDVDGLDGFFLMRFRKAS